MKSIEFTAILGISFLSGLMFFAFGIKLVFAVGIAFFLLALGFSMLHYLNNIQLPQVRLKKAEEAFRNGDFSAVYSNLANLSGLSPGEVRRAFRVAALLKSKSELKLLQEALEPRLQS